MKKEYIIIVLIIWITSLLFAEADFCGRTVLVVLEPSISHYTGSVDQEFWGNIDILSYENIFELHCEEAIKVLEEEERGFRSIYLLTLPIDDQENVLQVIRELKKIQGVEAAEPNYTMYPAYIPNDPDWEHPGLWTLKAPNGIDAQQAWKITTGSHNVGVGVIDSGITPHPDLNANLIPGWNIVDNSHLNTHDSLIGGNSLVPIWGHGTKTAGIIGAVGNNGLGVVGVNWNVRMAPLKISNSTRGDLPNPNAEIYVKAIRYAAEQWGVPNGRLSILNLSYRYYGERNPTVSGITLQAAINNFPGLFVWGAGNRWENVDDHTYIHDFQLSNLIAVGAYEVNDAGNIIRTWYSNYSNTNQYVHIYAPGNHGWTTASNGEYQEYEGTSMAAPHVSGVAALMLSVNPSLSAVQIKNYITSYSDHISWTTPLGTFQTVRKLNAFKPVLYSGTDVWDTDTVLNNIYIANNNHISISVIDNATVTISNSELWNESFISSEFFGYRVFEGTLIFDNCSIWSRALLHAFGENSTIIIRNSDNFNINEIKLYDGAKLIVQGSNIVTPYIYATGLGTEIIIERDDNNVASSFILSYGGSIVLEDQAQMEIDDSYLNITGFSHIYLSDIAILRLSNRAEFDMNGSILNLSGRSRVQLYNASKWYAYNGSIIIGHTLGHTIDNRSEDPYSLMYMHEGYPYPPNPGLGGDRIDVHSSWLGFTDDVSAFPVTITSGGVGTYWGGIYFFNCQPNGTNITEPSIIRGYITGIRTIFLHNSEVIVENITFEDMGFILATDKSRLHLKNAIYEGNHNGITIEESYVWIEDSEINNNLGDFGIKIAYCDDPTSTILNTFIHSNEGIGLQVDHGYIRVTDTSITENSKWGVYNLSSNPITIKGTSVIADNNFSQIISTQAGFPDFVWDTLTLERPEIHNDSFISDTLGEVLIHVLPPYEDYIYAHHLLIDTDDDTRFVPSMDNFSFEPPSSYGPQAIYELSIQYTLNGDFLNAYDGFSYLISAYPKTYQAKRALSILPYVYKAMYGGIQGLYDYLDSIEAAYLKSSIIEIKALLNIYNKNFIKAISLYQEILADPPNDLAELLAELNAGYAYYKLVMDGGSRASLDIPSQPASFSEFLDLQNDIHNRILKLTIDEEIEDNEPIVVYDYLLGNNYPNPFNPETTIEFSIGSPSSIRGDKGGVNVRLDIYNIKGQRIKTLLDENVSSGKHQVIWNGTDEAGRTVGSGIYFYQLKTEEFTQTKKMVLLK